MLSLKRRVELRRATSRSTNPLLWEVLDALDDAAREIKRLRNELDAEKTALNQIHAAFPTHFWTAEEIERGKQLGARLAREVFADADNWPQDPE
jgi:hypothetical protein